MFTFLEVALSKLIRSLAIFLSFASMVFCNFQPLQSSERTSSEVESAKYYVERGENLLALGKFDEAVSHLHYGYELSSDAKVATLELRSLFAVMLAYVCLDKEEEALQVSYLVQKLLDEMQCKDCGKVRLCNDDDYVIGPEQEPYDGWCEEAVSTTGAALKGVVRGARLGIAARETLVFTIDKFQQQAMKCCAKGGLWKACVGPLAKKLYEWRVLGIPPDAAWD